MKIDDSFQIEPAFLLPVSTANVAYIWLVFSQSKKKKKKKNSKCQLMTNVQYTLVIIPMIRTVLGFVAAGSVLFNLDLIDYDYFTGTGTVPDYHNVCWKYGMHL